MSVISEKVKAAQDLVEVLTHVKEWDVDLLLVSPTVQQRLDMVAAYTTWSEDVDGNQVATLDRGAMSPALVIACAHDPETRERAFEDSDLEMLQTKNGVVVNELAELCAPLVGFGRNEGPTDAGKDDSSTTPGDATESDSLVGSGAR